MRAYIIRRLILIPITLLLASLIVFFVVRLIPGDIIDQMLTEHAYITGSTDREKLERALGLDAPIPVQYGRWLGVLPRPNGQGQSSFNGILQGNLGDSLWTRTPVTEEIFARLPVTFELGLMAVVIALLISMPIGIYSAIRQDTVGDYIARSFAIACIAIPGFWIGTMVMIFPSKWWGWSPPVILIHFADDPLANLGMFIIPAAVLGMALSGVTMRMTRTMMLEVLRQDYIRTAWSKGLKERAVVMRHAMKNALIPVITLIGLQLPILIGGTVVMEQIFCLPGMGLLMLEKTLQRDYTIVIGVMLTIGVSVLLINLIIDLTYGFLDPRVQY